MGSRTGPVVVAAIVVLLLVLVAASNLQPVTMYLFTLVFTVPVALIVAGSFFGGALVMYGFAAQKLSQDKASEKALSKWESEDQKLLQQVQSDREKQLEAKIATLEAALNKALKKS